MTGEGSGHAAEPTASLWLSMLRICLVASVPATVVVAIVGAVAGGWTAAASAVLAGVVVVAFFSISLLVGHRFRAADGSRALQAFAVTYVIKVVGFGALLLLPARPDWVVGGWFLGSAVAVLLVWQGAEMVGFARSRRLYLP